jgi:tripartite-type tricarboxylate transporter receptor subunit TctC
MRKELGLKRSAIVLMLIFMGLIFPVGSTRAEYPDRSVTIIVGFDPGAATDITTRVIASGAEKYMGKSFIIENKGGGAGTVALALVANARPDGYTLCAAPNVAIVDTPLMQKVPFKPLKSFAPLLGHSAAENTGLLVKSDAPWKTFKEFIDYAKKNPGKVKYSTSGIGTGMHVAMEVIAKKDGITWVHIPYKGAAPATTALLGGHVDACSAGVGYQPQVLSGALRILATHGTKRSPDFPNAPTLVELGYDFHNDTVHAIQGPAGLPPDVVRKLESAFSKAMETPEFKSAQQKLYLTPVYYTSTQYEQHLKDKWVKTEKLFKDTGIIKEAATQPQ